MIDLSALTTKKKANGKGAALPVFDADDELKEIADEVVRLAELESTSKSAQEVLQSEIKSRLRQFSFETNHGKSTVQATVSLPGHTSEVLVALKDAYVIIDDLEDIKMIIGEERAHKFFRQQFEIKISSELIPEDMQQEVVDRITTLLQERGCADAIGAKVKYKPAKSFATERHVALSVDENLALEGNGDRGITIMSVAGARGRK